MGYDWYFNDVESLQELLARKVELTIEPGVDVVATPFGSLRVLRGSKLNASGTAEQPITFSSIDDGYDGVGEWGGIALLGFAPIYYGDSHETDACFNRDGNNTGRDLSEAPFNWCNDGSNYGNAGGDHFADSSGSLRYLRILESGSASR